MAFNKTPKAVAWFTQIGVVGAGLMGSGIAQTAALNGFPVTLVDVKQEYLDNAAKMMEQTGKAVLGFQVKRGKMKQSAADRMMKDTMSRITMTTDIHALNESDIVIESVIENMEIKQKLFDSLQKVLQDDAIIGSNTSSLSITELGQMSGRPEQFCGLHFFNPVMVMRLAEIIRTPQTSDRTYNAAKKLSELMGKVPVQCGDTPGFIVNRLLVPYLSQACLMVDRGDATFSDIDKAMKLGAGMPQGPMQLADFVGLDTCHSILSGWMEKYPDEKIFQMPQSLEAKFKEGKFGRKSGEGFYRWKGDKIIE